MNAQVIAWWAERIAMRTTIFLSKAHRCRCIWPDHDAADLIPVVAWAALAQPETRLSLDAYIAANLNIAEAAARLNLRPNSLRYRLRRIAVLTGLDPTRVSDLLELLAASRSCTTRSNTGFGHRPYRVRGTRNKADARSSHAGRGFEPIRPTSVPPFTSRGSSWLTTRLA